MTPDFFRARLGEMVNVGLFVTVFHNEGTGKRRIEFAASVFAIFGALAHGMVISKYVLPANPIGSYTPATGSSFLRIFRKTLTSPCGDPDAEYRHGEARHGHPRQIGPTVCSAWYFLV